MEQQETIVKRTFARGLRSPLNLRNKTTKRKNHPQKVRNQETKFSRDLQPFHQRLVGLLTVICSICHRYKHFHPMHVLQCFCHRASGAINVVLPRFFYWNGKVLKAVYPRNLFWFSFDDRNSKIVVLNCSLKFNFLFRYIYFYNTFDYLIACRYLVTAGT